MFHIWTGSNCFTAFYIINPGLRSIDAIPIKDVTTQDICEARCRMNASCLSYQIDPNPQNVFCWQQHSQDKLRPENLYSEIAGVVEYVKLNNCTGTFPG